MSEERWDAIVVGAGISGLSARRLMLSRGLRVLTIEKSRGLGGRASTRRLDGKVFDLGAQFFSARGAELQSLVSAWQLKHPAELSALTLTDASHYPRTINRNGMSRITSLLLEDPVDPDSPILRSTRVVEIQSDESGGAWQVITEGDRVYRARSVVISAPIPQSIELLKPLQASMDVTQLKRLQEVGYDSCVAVAYELSEPSGMKDLGVLRHPSNEVIGIFDQVKKGVLSSAPILVVHAAPGLSQSLWSDSDTVILNELWKRTRTILDVHLSNENFLAGWVHRWRYSEPQVRLDRFFETIEIVGCSPLFLVGDSFRDSKIEGAFESGRQGGLAVVERQ